MMPERFQKISQIYNQTQDLESGRGGAILFEACASNEGLRNEVESLLNAHLNANGHIDLPAVEVEMAVTLINNLDR